MSNLHALFALRNEQAFARALDATRTQSNTQTQLSSSGGRSWTRTMTGMSASEVNARDWLGRTVLHLVCATPEPFALAYVRLLLAHPGINVNVQDVESRWTPLHRALYAGNLAATLMLLQRTDTETQLRDYDGYTPFDLYNSTVDGTAPEEAPQNGLTADLFTWGINRNAALGHGDAADRAHPDQVVVQPVTPPAVTSPARFTPIRVRGISMDKLHTTVITDEPRGNLRVCGFGSGGRLGTGQHTQYSLQPVPQLSARIVAVALGQDHTLALSDAGEVLSWGLNRFAQLGYALERDEQVQTVAKRVLGLLRKEEVVGLAACRSASACWTREDVFTWGTNSGQLGYDRAAQPVQVLPRKVTGVQGVTQIALTDSAMACLLETKDVICFRGDTHFRVKFPAPDLANIPAYQHPHVVKPAITKITSTDGVFAALSSRGDIFTFATPPPPSEAVPRPAVKPQRVWSLRKAFDPAQDVALGQDGALIICTAAGHVFVRARPGAKAQRIAHVHRVVRVCASSTGAFAALRSTPAPRAVRVVGAGLGEDLRAVRPWISGEEGGRAVGLNVTTKGAADEDEEDSALEWDVATTARLCALLGESETPSAHHGADVVVNVGRAIPAHRAILAARSGALRALLDGGTKVLRDGGVKITYTTRLVVAGCHPMAVLLLLEYLYTDDIPALWDRRVSGPCAAVLARAGIVPGVIKTQLMALARAVALPALIAALAAPTKRIPTPTLAHDMAALFHGGAETAAPADVVLALANGGKVQCHAVVLRARSGFFRSFFDDADWTARRWPAGGVLEVDMRHMGARAVGFVMRWVCGGEEPGLFEGVEDVESVPELLDLVFDVMAVASELLLDKLMLVCSAVILRHVNLQNAASLLADATYYNALDLVASLHAYIVSNMEAVLEAHLLDDAPPDLVRALAAAVRAQQKDKAPVTRENRVGEAALRAWAAWLVMQDVPGPILRSQRTRESPKMEAVRRVPPMSPIALTKASPPKAVVGDDIFAMEDDAVPALSIGLAQVQQQQSPAGYSIPPPAWKAKTAQGAARVDMKAIMAEAETRTQTQTAPRVVGLEGADQSTGTPPRSSQKMSQRERRKMQAQTAEEPVIAPPAAASSSSPWRMSSQQASMPALTVAQRPPTTHPASRVVVSTQEPVPATPRRQPATPGSVLQTSSSSSSLGPLFTPTNPIAVQRRVSSDYPAWTKVSAHDTTPPAASSGLSFAAIQQQQRDQGQKPAGKQSLREIQQEEAARQEEEDFMRWWAAEEQRLKAEAEGMAEMTTMAGGAAGKRGRGGKRGARGGGARGRRGDSSGGGGAPPSG